MKPNKRIYDAFMRIFIVLCYFMPYGFLAIKGDVQRGSILYYFLAFAASALLALLSGIKNHRLVSLGGQALSLAVSVSLVLPFNEEWAYYTKPLTPLPLLLAVTAMMLLVHLLIWLFLFLVNYKEPFYIVRNTYGLHIYNLYPFLSKTLL